MTAASTHAVSRAEPISANRSTSVSVWAGRVLTGIVSLFLTFDVAVKLLEIPAAVEGTAQLGFPPHALLTIGVLGLICLVLYLVPRTAVLGAVLWTGYLGGAIATHLRLENPLFSHTLFPVYVGAFIWVGLWLRMPPLRAIAPFVREQN